MFWILVVIGNISGGTLIFIDFMDGPRDKYKELTDVDCNSPVFKFSHKILVTLTSSSFGVGLIRIVFSCKLSKT